MLNLNTSAQNSVESLSQSNMAEERNVKHSSWKRNLTVPICRRMILQIVNSIKIPLKTIKTNKWICENQESCRTQNQHIKVIELLCSWSTYVKRNQEKNLFTIATIGIKYLGINLTKKMKDISTEHWWKKMKTERNGENLCLQVGRVNTVITGTSTILPLHLRPREQWGSTD